MSVCLIIKFQIYMNCLHKKEITVTDLVNESYKRIGEVEAKVQAFLNIG